MSLVKWFRKNNRKLLAGVVVVIMIGFTIGPVLRRLGGGGGPANNVVANFGDGDEITTKMRYLARQELKILRMLSIAEMLSGAQETVLGVNDLHFLFSAALLFPETGTSALAIENNVKQIVRTNGYPVTDRQIYRICEPNLPADVCWILLTKEVEQAGFCVSRDMAKAQLSLAIPQIFRGARYENLMAALIKQGVSEEAVLKAFARVMSVVQYGRILSFNEAFTARQLKQIVSRRIESVDVNFVEVPAAVFAEEQPEPDEAAVQRQFEKYKAFLPGQVDDNNPYGFGYKLDDRLRLEYFIVKLDDVVQTIEKPAGEEMEKYYSEHINDDEFIRQVPSDPNDPNSFKIEQTKSYAEMADFIFDILKRQRTNIRAAEILDEAKSLTQCRLERSEGSSQPTLEELRNSSGDYEAAAVELMRKYDVKVYCGRTGLLNPFDLFSDRYLRRLYVAGGGTVSARLLDFVFAMESLGRTELPGSFRPPQFYENIGPLYDMYDELVAVVRVVETCKAHVPESMDVSLGSEPINLDDSNQPPGEPEFSLTKVVIEDLRTRSAMTDAQKAARELISLAEEQGWEKALDELNQRYGRPDINEPDESILAADLQTPFLSRELTGLKRIAEQDIAATALALANNPIGNMLINNKKQNKLLVDRLYTRAKKTAADVNKPDDVPFAMEFRPRMCWYVVQDLKPELATRLQYRKIKASAAFRQNIVRSQSLAAVHYEPRNIIRRNKFKWVETSKEQQDANE